MRNFFRKRRHPEGSDTAQRRPPSVGFPGPGRIADPLPVRPGPAAARILPEPDDDEPPALRAASERMEAFNTAPLPRALRCCRS